MSRILLVSDELAIHVHSVVYDFPFMLQLVLFTTLDTELITQIALNTIFLPAEFSIVLRDVVYDLSYRVHL